MPASGPGGITAGPDGALWFTNNDGNDSIGRITTGGVVSNYTDASISDPMGSRRGRTAPSGSPTTATTRSGGSPPAAVSATTRPQHQPSDGIAVGPDGALWFTDHATTRSGESPPAGKISTYRDGEHPRPGGGSTLGPDGALWFANRDNDSIGRARIVARR